MRVLVFFAICAVFLFMSCQNDGGNISKAEKTVEEIKAESKISNSQVVRNPVSANDPIDTVNVAKIKFDTPEGYDFGTVKEGTVVEHTFAFTNTGKIPLVISDARSTCGCTVPEKPQEPIAPGEKGEIKVKFNTKGKPNQQSKPIIITANTYPKESRVMLTGTVQPVKDEKVAKN